MSTPVRLPRRWDTVEKATSLTLIATLLAFIGCRLAFAVWWPLPTFDFVFSAIAVVLMAMVVALAFARRRRSWRVASIIVAGASQVAPMVWREPMLLVPVLGGLIPIAVIGWALVALSRKGRSIAVDPQHR